MDRALKIPGVTNAWTMPIKARIDMLTTGVRTPVGIKIFGPDLKQIERIGEHLEMVLKEVPGTRSVYAERVSGGYFLDFEINRDEIARYGLKLMDVGKISRPPSRAVSAIRSTSAISVSCGMILKS
jgi:Cu(I)/Ag(I) efflux system membrane protein CusA/SilA